MSGPPLTREQVAATLRRLRAGTDLSRSAAAREVGVNQSTVSRLEDGRHVPTLEQMTRLLDLYGADGATRSEMLASSRESRGQRQQQVVMHHGATTAQRRIGESEARAVRVTTFTPTIVPGLLQSAGYMRAIGGTALQGAELDSWVAARTGRQHTLREPGVRELVQLTTFGALTWALGGQDVMREQIRHLQDITGWSTVRFGIVPAGREARLFPLHGFDVHDGADGSRLVFYGTHSGVVTVADPTEQVELLAVLAEAERLAVYGSEARAELERAARLYR